MSMSIRHIANTVRLQQIKEKNLIIAVHATLNLLAREARILISSLCLTIRLMAISLTHLITLRLRTSLRCAVLKLI